MFKASIIEAAAQSYSLLYVLHFYYIVYFFTIIMIYCNNTVLWLLWERNFPVCGTIKEFRFWKERAKVVQASNQDPPGRLPLKVVHTGQTGRISQKSPRTSWRYNIAHLAWERLGIPRRSWKELLEDWKTLNSPLPPNPEKANVEAFCFYLPFSLWPTLESELYRYIP